MKTKDLKGTASLVLDERLRRFLPLRIILRKELDGRYSGMVENSFSLSYDTHRVNIFWSGEAYSFLGKHKLDAVRDAEYNAPPMGGEIFDPLSPGCPIAVDLASWLDTLADKTSHKFDRRNAFFEQR